MPVLAIGHGNYGTLFFPSATMRMHIVIAPLEKATVMAYNSKAKLKVLYLWKILQEETDAEHGLSMTQILERLDSYGISAERKSIYDDIKTLRDFDIDIKTYQRNPVEYAIERRDFTLEELMLMVDAVQSCRAITERQARMLITNPGTCRDYTTAIGTELYPNAGIPLICIPTTAGTGSEVTFTAVMHDVENQRKISTRDRDKLVPDYAILDPAVTVTLPPEMTGATGLDAMAHAIEGFLKPEAHCYCDPLCIQAMKMVYFNLKNAYEHPDDLEARDNMLLAANIAMGGMADVGVQIGHGIGQALGAYTHAPHGVTCAWALPYVIEHLYDVEAAKVRQIADAFALDLPADASPETVRDAIEQLSADVHLPMPRDLGCTMEKDYDNFVKFVLREQRLIQMSAKHVSDDDVRRYMTDLMTRAH